MKLYVGTAGWNIPTHLKEKFEKEGSQLERYSKSFSCVEINSSFYKEHKPETYQKWASVADDGFKFSVKLAKYFIHEKRLKESGPELGNSLAAIMQLGEKLGAILVQLPKSLEFNQKIVSKFLSQMRRHYLGPILWEPRGESWLTEKSLDLLADYQVSKVLADPEPYFLPKKKRERLEEIRYFRLHGTPQIYKSSYDEKRIHSLARVINKPGPYTQETWCIFDNTAFGHATQNALDVLKLNKEGRTDRHAR